MLNYSGQTAFGGSLTGPSVDSTNDSGNWSEGSGGGLTLTVRAGNTAPDTDGAAQFSSFEAPLLNNNGQTAFMASLTGATVDSTNNSGIWSEGGGGGLALVDRVLVQRELENRFSCVSELGNRFQFRIVD